MGMRVIIENTGDPGDEVNSSSSKVEFYDPSPFVEAERLGQLIGYAINASESFYIPGDVVEGIRDVIRDHNT